MAVYVHTIVYTISAFVYAVVRAEVLLYPCCSLSSLSIKQRLNDIVCANCCVNECTPYVIVHIHRQEWCFLARGITLYHIVFYIIGILQVIIGRRACNWKMYLARVFLQLVTFKSCLKSK